MCSCQRCVFVIGRGDVLSQLFDSPAVDINVASASALTPFCRPAPTTHTAYNTAGRNRQRQLPTHFTYDYTQTHGPRENAEPIMGRRPKAIVAEFFQRGQKLDDSSNRYEHTCKKCGDHVSIAEIIHEIHS